MAQPSSNHPKTMFLLLHDLTSLSFGDFNMKTPLHCGPALCADLPPPACHSIHVTAALIPPTSCMPGPLGCDPPPTGPPRSSNPLSSPSAEGGRGGVLAPQLPLSVFLETFKRIKGWGLGTTAFRDACSVDEKMRSPLASSSSVQREGWGVPNRWCG